MAEHEADDAETPSLERVDRELRRMRDDLGDLGDTLTRIGTGLDDLTRRIVPSRAEELEKDKWQARLGGLETRLSMLESTIRSEADRVHTAASVVDSVADELRATLGTSRSMEELAGDIRNGVDLLSELLGAEDDRRPLTELAGEVRALRGEVAAQVRPVGERLDALGRGTADRIDALDRGTTERLDDLRRALAGDVVASVAERLTEVGSRMTEVETSLTDRITAVDGAMAELRSALAGFEAAQPRPDELVEPLDRRLAAVEGSLSGLSTHVADLRSATPDVDAAVTPLVDRVATANSAIVALRGDVKAIADGIGEQVQSMRETVTTVLTELRDLPTPDPIEPKLQTLAAQLERIVHDVVDNDVAGLQRGLEARDAEIGAAVAELRTSRGDIDAALGLVLERVDALASAPPPEPPPPVDLGPVLQRLDSLANTPPPEPVGPLLDQLAEQLSVTLGARADDDVVRLQRLIEQGAESHRAAVTELRGSWPDLAAALAPLYERLEVLDEGTRNAGATAAQSGAATNERIDALGAAVRAMHESRPDITTSLQTIAGLLDGLRTQGADTRGGVERLTDEVASVTARAGQPLPDLERLPGLLEGITQRLDNSSAESTQVRERIDGFLDAVAELRRELASADEGDDGDVALVLNRIDQVGQQMGRAGQAQTERLDRLAASLGQQITASGTVEQALLSIRAELTERLDQIARQADEQQAVAGSAGRAADGLRTELTSRLEVLDTRLAEQSAALAAAIATEHAQLQAVREATDGAMQSVRSDVAAHAAEVRNDVRQLAEEAAQRSSDAADGAELRALLDQLAAHVGRTATDVTGLGEHVSSRLAALEASLDAGVDDLRARVTQTDESPAQLVLLDELRGAVAQLADRVDAVPSLGRPDVEAAVESAIWPIVAATEERTAQIERVAAASSDLSTRVDALRAEIAGIAQRQSEAADPGEIATRVDEVRATLAGVEAALAEVRRSDRDVVTGAVAAATAGTSQHIDGAVAGLSERLDALAASVSRDVDDLRERLAAIGDAGDIDWGPAHDELRRAVQADLRAAVEPLRTDVMQASAASDAARDELRAALDAALEALRNQMGRTGEDAAAMREGLRADIDALRTDLDALRPAMAGAVSDGVAGLGPRLEDLQAAVQRAEQTAELGRIAADLASRRERLEQPPDPIPVQAVVEQSVAGLAEQVRGQLESVSAEFRRSGADATAAREGLTAAVERVLARVDADADRVLDTVVSGEGAVRDQLRKMDGGLAEIRRDLEQLARVSDAVDALSTVTRQSAVPDRLVTAVTDLQRDLNAVRDEVIAVTRVVGGLRAELRQGDGEMSGAGAALVASAAAAMARLEARLDHEFEAVSRHMESLGTLVHHAVDAIDGLEGQLAQSERGAATPVGERLRATASSVLDSIRTAGRERAARRTRGGGPRSLNP